MRFCCRRSAILFWLLVATASIQRQCANAQASFANVTLKANKGDLSVVIYLPQGIKPDEPTYYLSSRFDHSSMIGNIQRTTRNPDTGEKFTRILYGGGQWRVPHDPYWPESGIGLAAEFGVGDDGAFCNYRCGWYQVNEVTNGVLGHQEAKNGESFLKIGVGELIKGSCATCDSTDDFKFNSPYRFASQPVWRLKKYKETNSIALSQEAVLNQYGYTIRKEIQLNDDELLVKSTLTNIGRVPFATAWYSHHFFTCDNHPVGKGLGVDLDLAASGGNYDEPGTWFWSTPIENYATITPKEDVVSVEMNRGVERNVRIKAEFSKNEQTHGTFTLHGCETSIRESIPEVGTEGGVSMYAYNLYIESGAFSPEPQIYMHLWPGQSISWTQRLEFNDYDESLEGFKMKDFVKAGIAPTDKTPSLRWFDRAFIAFALTAACFAFCVQIAWKQRLERSNYSPIPDHERMTEASQGTASEASRHLYV